MLKNLGHSMFKNTMKNKFEIYKYNMFDSVDQDRFEEHF